VSEKKELTLDLDRIANPNYHGLTGIFIRAKHEGKWGNFDIAELDEPGLMVWLRSRGGDNPWAESTVAILLGHRATEETPPGKDDD
jgi:hypothetical protein